MLAISFEFLVWAPVLLFSMVAHEYAHAEAAYRQGDDTAYMLGRLTLNPLKHIDPLMTVIVPFLLWRIGAPPFGAAKPVPVNPRKYRQFRRGDIIVSLAGIVVNLALFVACTLLFALVGVLGGALPAFTGTLEIVQRMLWWGMWLNVVLAFFNLIPVPPLDGSHVFYYLLPPGAGLKYRQLQAFGFLPVMVLVWAIPGVLQVLLWPAYHLMGVGVALVGCAPYRWAQSLLDVRGTARLVRSAAKRADVVVVYMHAGAEGAAADHVSGGSETYLGEPRGNPAAFAHAMIDAGADLGLASGPHVLRGMEWYRGRLVAYSLGNLATTPATRSGTRRASSGSEFLTVASQVRPPFMNTSTASAGCARS